MVWAAIVVGVGTLAYNIYSGSKQRKAAQKEADKKEEEAKRKNKLMEDQKAKYRALKFENPYSDVKNQFENMENAYEDLTVNQKQAEFEKDMAQQQQSNIMNKMAESAGGSGIAALAQTMANEGALKAQQVSASIGAQESQIQSLQAGEASKLQTLERRGEEAADLQRRKGEAVRLGQIADREATILGLEYGASAGAGQAAQAASMHQQTVDAETRQATADSATSLAGTVGGAYSSGSFKKKARVDPEWDKMTDAEKEQWEMDLINEE